MNPTNESIGRAFRELYDGKRHEKSAAFRESIYNRARELDRQAPGEFFKGCGCVFCDMNTDHRGMECTRDSGAAPQPPAQEQGEWASDLRAAFDHIATISGSALLSGEKCKREDRAILYREACSALSIVGNVMRSIELSPALTRAAGAEDARDAARLDFMIQRGAKVDALKSGLTGGVVYRVSAFGSILTDWHDTSRSAIDAAIDAAIASQAQEGEK